MTHRPPAPETPFYRCRFAEGAPKKSDQCANRATWKYTREIRHEEPLLPRGPVFCDEHRVGGMERA